MSTASFFTAFLMSCVLSSMAYDMTIDLRTGSIAYPATGAAAGIKWEVPLTTPTNESKCACDLRGVLKLYFNDVDRKFADITMVFFDSQEYSFNIGDSRSNNGWAGDANTQKDDAEVHAYHKSIFVYGKDNPAGGSYGLQASQGSFLEAVVQMRVGNDLFEAENGGITSPVSVNNEKIFAMDKESENYEVYFALNRVVQSAWRKGSGLCWVGITWQSA